MKEIGSEFWTVPGKYGDIAYLLAGRTALEYIIREILARTNICSVLLPSYCCHTMIEPFVRHNIHVRFYDVFFDDAKGGLCVDIPDALANEIFYFMDYFGFRRMQEIDCKTIRSDWEVIIDDRTHSWLSSVEYDDDLDADYQYISFRKWAAFDAISIAISRHGKFKTMLPVQTNQSYCDIRNKAFDLKNSYIATGIENKSVFLSLFNKAEEMLENDYIGYRPSLNTIQKLSLFDTVYVHDRRYENAKTLISQLQGIPGIKLPYKNVHANETPLFVPIVVMKNRDSLRKFLIDNQVYCPVHWPLSTFHNGISKRAEDLYMRELSLVCDQRYGIDDMNKIIALIRKYISEAVR